MQQLKRKNKQNISNRKYGQVKVRFARRGVYSCLFAIGVILFQGILLYSAYVTHGEAPTIVGALGIMSIILAGLGIEQGIRGFRERDKNYLTCKIGIVINGLMIIFSIFLFVRGMV